MEEQEATGKLTDEELESVNAGMADAGPDRDYCGTADSSHNAEIIAKGKHSTMVLTCRYCSHRGVMDRYTYTYTYDGGYGPEVMTDRIQVCRNCKEVSKWAKGGGC